MQLRRVLIEFGDEPLDEAAARRGALLPFAARDGLPQDDVRGRGQAGILEQARRQIVIDRHPRAAGDVGGNRDARPEDEHALAAMDLGDEAAEPAL